MWGKRKYPFTKSLDSLPASPNAFADTEELVLGSYVQPEQRTAIEWIIAAAAVLSTFYKKKEENKGKKRLYYFRVIFLN